MEPSLPVSRNRSASCHHSTTSARRSAGQSASPRPCRGAPLQLRSEGSAASSRMQRGTQCLTGLSPTRLLGSKPSAELRPNRGCRGCIPPRAGFLRVRGCTLRPGAGRSACKSSHQQIPSNPRSSTRQKTAPHAPGMPADRPGTPATKLGIGHARSPIWWAGARQAARCP